MASLLSILPSKGEKPAASPERADTSGLCLFGGMPVLPDLKEKGARCEEN